LTESFGVLPAESVCGFYFSHLESRYFAVGKIDRDQVLDYQRRKGMDLPAVERRLALTLIMSRSAGVSRVVNTYS
jgi:5-methyltetrahydrofolate--homocysteine methyltransferase